jgi:hypothetical protein
MRAIMIYRDNTEYSRVVQEFLRDMTRQTNKSLEEIDPDSSDGTQFCETYDIMEYPTIVVLDDNGSILNSWRGLPLPLISEVSYYAR